MYLINIFELDLHDALVSNFSKYFKIIILIHFKIENFISLVETSLRIVALNSVT